MAIKNLLFSYCLVIKQGKYEKNSNNIILKQVQFMQVLPNDGKKYRDKIAEAQMLRDQGMAAHDAGDHAKSEDI